MGELKLDFDSYEFFFNLIKKNSGIELKKHKIPLLENRLRKRILQLSINSLEEYILYIKNTPQELNHCIPLLTTHKTEWFREIIHYQWIQENLLLKNKSIKIWSAACSSGEEVYSLLFLCIKNGYRPFQVKITGSDISEPILQKAINLPSTDGFFKQLSFLEKKIGKSISEEEVDNYNRLSVKFFLHNLVSSPPLESELYDLIIVRNVFIYFDSETIDHVIDKLLKNLKPGGHLIIGLSESINFSRHHLTNLGNSIFRYKSGGK